MRGRETPGGRSRLHKLSEVSVCIKTVLCARTDRDPCALSFFVALPWQMPIVGRYVGCSTPTEAAHAAHEAWRVNFTHTFVAGSASGKCGTFCQAHGDLYLEDRCWNTRSLCAIATMMDAKANNVVSTVVVGQRTAEPHNLLLHSGRFLTVLGPAAALGVGARNGFADRLRERMGVPVVNLGRGAAGPSDYISAWTSLAPLLSQSRANIVVVMAGRSSANSAFPAGNGPSGSVSMARDAGIKRLQTLKDPRWPRLVNESLATALAEYADLASRIRANAQSLGRTPPPFLLLWFSSCEMARGCEDITTFPQYYTNPVYVHRLASHIGARLVDASFGSVEPAAPLALDQCEDCRALNLGGTARAPSCLMDDARRQTNYVGFAPQDWTEGRMRKMDGGPRRAERLATLGCTQSCRAVLPTYYPHDAAHEVAAAALTLSLLQHQQQKKHVSSSLSYGRSSPLAAARTSLRSILLDDVPRINVRHKVFFHHVHKSAGSSFSRLLRRLPGSTWCDQVMNPNGVAPTSYSNLRRWWIGDAFNCTMVSLEEPWLGSLVRAAAEWTKSESDHHSTQHALRDAKILRTFSGHTLGTLPQMISFFRHPVDRCVSSWRYEFALCHGSHAMDEMHKSYCLSFVEKYGNGVDLESQRAFVKGQCTDHLFGELERNHLDWDAALVLLGLARDATADGGPTKAEDAKPGSLVRMELSNAGKDCWLPCHSQPGSCTSFCGGGGACCKQNSNLQSAQCGSGALGCIENHCCVLDEQSHLPPIPVAPLLFYGMTEDYDASICLFWFQIGAYTPENWKQSLCTCDSRAELRQSLRQYDQPWTRSKEKNSDAPGGGQGAPTIAGRYHVVPPELLLSRDELERLNPHDMAFHRAAKEEFERRVAVVEERVGHRFLRC